MIGNTYLELKLLKNHLSRPNGKRKYAFPCNAMLLSILEPSRLVRNLPSDKHIDKNLMILQTNRPSNSSSA